MAKRLYRGTCHCGSIRFEFRAAEIASAMRCTCSICRRNGALLSDFVLAGDVLKINSDHDLLGEYQFGTKTAAHYFCRRCGVFTHVRTRLNPGHYRVNLGCIDDLNLSDLEIAVFDGESL